MTAPGTARVGDDGGAFCVDLDVFAGPFDLLLRLIASHQLDLTQLALSQVTDEFLAHLRGKGAEWDLGVATEFLVVAATLLELKAVRLLPTPDVEDEEDLALLEARDLLFARLLQYRAFKEAAGHLSVMWADQARRYPRPAVLEPRFAALLPDVVLAVGVNEFARLAAQALQPRPQPRVAADHLHHVPVDVAEQARLLRERLQRSGGGAFRELTADCTSTIEVVVRFLVLLEMYREGQVGLTQVVALGDLQVRWTGPDTDDAAPVPVPVAVTA